MGDLNPVEMKRDLVEKLIATGVPEEEAKQLASKEIDSMGAVKTSLGECPLGGASPMACMFCWYGHMTECHYPLTCEEAQCSHYQAEMDAEGELDAPDTWDDLQRD